MKAKEFIIEVKSSEPPKPRNFVAKHAQKTTSGAGAHKDKKRAEKQGNVKHKKQAIPMEGAAGTKPGWMLKQDPKLGAKVKAKTDLAKKRQASYGDPSAGKSVDKQGVAETSDISGLISAASMVQDYIITAEVDGKTKKFRVRGMTGPRAAKERFLKHASMAKILDVKPVEAKN